MKSLLQERRKEEYTPLFEQFLQDIHGLDVKGIPEPHVPIIGKSYEFCKYKIAFCGMETYTWGNLSDIVDKSPEELVTAGDYTINELEYLGWPKNYHATFWGFIFHFISRFYSIPFEDITNGNNKEILTSFIWANTNSIERFSVSSEGNGANYKVWEAVKKASQRFDDLNHIINVASPQLVLLLYSGVGENYFLDDSTLSSVYGMKIDGNYLKLSDHSDLGYRYYYKRQTGTHIFCLPHPRYMGLYSGKGFSAYIDSLLQDIRDYRIWPNLPGEAETSFALPASYNKQSIEYKRELIASLAKYLLDNDVVMSGKEIQELFNMNGIKTKYGFEYGQNGGVGVHRLISNVWAYYHNELKDYQTAYNIARAFVNQNGDYAYDIR